MQTYIEITEKPRIRHLGSHVTHGGAWQCIAFVDATIVQAFGDSPCEAYTSFTNKVAAKGYFAPVNYLHKLFRSKQ